MFIFFVNDTFYSFWQNKKGQIFYDLTVKGLGLVNEQVSLSHYRGLISIPSLFAFDHNKNLLIQEKQVTIIDDVEVEELVTISTIPAEPFVVNGEKVLSC